MNGKKSPNDLDEAKVLLTLNHLAHQFLDAVPEDQRLSLETAEDARCVLTALADQFGSAPAGLSSEQVVADGADVGAIGRAALSMFLEDPDFRDDVEDLLAEPPEDEQMSGLEVVAESAVVLGALVAWLQTKVELSAAWTDGKPHFSITLRKDTTDKETISCIVDRLTKLISR